MTILEYVAKFTELARFGDDYVATDMAKVRKLEDCLKLSIWGKIMGFLLQDVDSMVMTSMAIEGERLMTQRASRMQVLVGRGRRANLLLAWGRSRGLLLHSSFRGRATAIRAKARSGILARQDR